MSGLLRRIRGARATVPDPAPDAGAARPQEGDEARVQPETTDSGGHPALPAGVDLDRLVGERPTTARRRRLRRRLRHLRSVREVLLRDLGGLVLEVHRSGRAGDEGPSQLIAGKLARLDAVSEELRDLEQVLAEPRGTVLREPGIGGACPACGELFGSDARFCWACGTPVAPGASRPVLESRRPVTDLPALGAAAKEGVPSNEWQPGGVDAPAPARAAPGGPEEPAPPQAPSAPAVPDEAPTVVQRPHIDGSGEELRPGDPLMDRQP